MLSTSQQRAQAWLENKVIDEHTKQAIRDLLDSSDKEPLIHAFYKELDFGTGGLRGITGAGSNRINQYTVGRVTQGLANYLRKIFSGTIRVAIAYDSRNDSAYFSDIVARIFSANGIEVYQFSELRPTPILSYAIRYLRCQSGVVITASHNPKEYNGYKVYWEDGSQLVAPHDKQVIESIRAIEDFSKIQFTPNPKLIHIPTSDVENTYYDQVLASIPEKEKWENHLDISIVYSSLHGSGITMVPPCLRKIGFSNVHIVEEQRIPDGNFPTVPSPNPEEHSAMKMALQLAQQVKAELVMATDPDTDRVGIAIPDSEGSFILLTGNQALSLLVHYLLRAERHREQTYIAKTIVTSELVDAIAHHYGVECINTLTGFKYIAEILRDREGKKKFIVGGEESYGYLVGDFVRDKDAVSACAFFSVMAAQAKFEGKSLYQWLIELYCDFDLYKEKLVNVVKKGVEGEQQIKSMMTRFRTSSPTQIAGEKVTSILDYLSGERKENGVTTPLPFPKSDVIQFYTQQGSKISVRPSGTEPKIKFYFSLKSPLSAPDKYDEVNQALETRMEQIIHELLL